jgi:hypothetical protein
VPVEVLVLLVVVTPGFDVVLLVAHEVVEVELWLVVALLVVLVEPVLVEELEVEVELL